MKVERNDIVHSENFLKLIKKLKCELEGEEILAAAECIKWFYRHSQELKVEFNKPSLAVTSSSLPEESKSSDSNIPSKEKPSKKK